jgi:hypothetical protein
MELLRRALLLGCTLPAIWLFRLATLDPMVSVLHVEAPAPDEPRAPGATLAVQGEAWGRFLGGIDGLERGLGPQDHWRMSDDVPEPGGTARWVFYRSDEKPVDALVGRLASGGGTTFVSISGRDGDLQYRVDRREWSRQDFRPGGGFSGRPVPPSTLLYPFQSVAYAIFLLGIALFGLVPSPTRARGGVSPGELALLAATLLLFAVPLLATGGSVQALTRGLSYTLPCWLLAAVAAHFFARPGQNAPYALLAPAPIEPGPGPAPARPVLLPVLLRWGLAMLAVALGPVTALVAVSLRLWDR